MRSVCCGHVHQADAGGYCADCPDAGAIELGANPYQVVRNFEAALCRYTGAPYVVTVNSCTMALLLAVAWHLRTYVKRPMEMASPPFQDCEMESLSNVRNRMWNSELKPPKISIPKRTYVSVPQSIIHAGGRPTFRDEDWSGAYQLTPLPVWDSARRLTSGMFAAGRMQCVSFHASKILGDTQGGAILHDSPEADLWLRRARFDGRAEGVAPKDDAFTQVGWHCYMSSDVAARLLLKLHSLPRHNADLPNDDYPDLSRIEIFK